MMHKFAKFAGSVGACGLLTTLFIAPVNAEPQAAENTVTKLLVFVEENHSISQMKAGMPYAFGLATRYGYATQHVATMHPSLPNYIAIAGGKTYGITDNGGPGSNGVDGMSVFGQAIAAGKTAKVYADGMTSNCAMGGGTAYAVRHNPWPYFVNESALCNKFDVPVAKLDADIAGGTLPNAGMVIPNLDHDAHDGSLAAADQWFKGWMTKIFASPDWRSGHLAVMLTADEDDKNSGNVVLTTIIHPSQNGRVVTSKLTHHGITRLYEDVIGAPYLYAAATAPSFSTAFNLPMPLTGQPPTDPPPTDPPPVDPPPVCEPPAPTEPLPVSDKPITGFAVTAQGPNTIVVKWDAVTNAVKYRIQLSTSPLMAAAEYRRFETNAAILDGLKANTKYYLRVRTIDVDGGNISPYTSPPIVSSTR
ncbi:MAG: alkaline phosphatase family protein [Aeromicrobium sp.]